MSFVFENRPRVYDDIIEAVDYYFTINPSLAVDFLDRIEEAKTKILNTPEGFEVKRPHIRTVLLKQFDYHIYYTIDGFQIIILAILHAQSGQEKIDEI
ncbi:type II toxin-antitoxin system RelE/ParE family toxin [Epilithonimonas xixisoli]|uniref:Plasmid stabilization system protein ParE n=1 Tax=Epilithonimonas xixisoli TaxID=1476462 RepID=A0A4R8I3K9_9FLAO|nr:type II toxin-antitoxin system RelE/ParE family toxin [Epilithonimonas xixisoli]TDX82823.1 plasmid stabilization system protein ParE [Epilithonimonas xixisoli]